MPEDILWSCYVIHQGFISDITELPSNIQNLAGSIGGTIEGNSGNDGYSSEISGIISLAGGIHDFTWINSNESPIVSAFKELMIIQLIIIVSSN